LNWNRFGTNLKLKIKIYFAEMRVTISLLVVLSFVLAGTSYAFADTMQGSGSMSMHDSTMMNGSQMAGSSDKDMMNGNMSSAGWGSNGTMMKGENMMPGGTIDLSMASPVEGSPSAPVTIVEFGDYQCPECDSWFKNQEPTIKSNYIDTQKAKLYFVDFPWAGSDSISAAEASYCAGDQGKYWEYHNYLYQQQAGIQTGWASPSNLKPYATTLGLDSNQFNTCLDSGKYADRVSHNKDVGTSKGVQGTPTFFIMGSTGAMQEITGPQPASVFSTVIDQMSAQTTPEFGPIAVLVLAIAIVSIIAVSAKTGLRFIPRL
jgi:predicted secreted protein with PEFG-CTERM motif